MHVFYDERQVVDQPGHASPSSGKPREVLADWHATGLPVIIDPITPVTLNDFYRAHDKQYVDDILECRINNGFDNTSKEVAASLPYTTGSMLSAACWLLANKKQVAVSPTSGFHHAEYAKAQGFCTFNGLMITALSLKHENLVDTVGILDLDHHWGNGTDDIIDRLNIDWIKHYTIGEHRLPFKQLINGKTIAEYWMEKLPEICAQYEGCDILIYQAGADLWEKDPYAWGGGLSVAQLKERDRIVFTAMRDMGIPVVWNLAGGYVRDAAGSIRPVLDIHKNTAEVCCEIYGLKL